MNGCWRLHFHEKKFYECSKCSCFLWENDFVSGFGQCLRLYTEVMPLFVCVTFSTKTGHHYLSYIYADSQRNILINNLVIAKSTFVRRPNGASTAKAYGVLMVNILHKCILSILVLILFLDRHRNGYIHRYNGCYREIEIQICQKIRLSENIG